MFHVLASFSKTGLFGASRMRAIGAAASLGPPIQTLGAPPSAARWARTSLLDGRGSVPRVMASRLGDPVSTVKDLPHSQAQIRDDFFKQTQDPTFQGKGDPISQSKLQWDVAADDGSISTT